jgi:hypothetical protein
MKEAKQQNKYLMQKSTYAQLEKPTIKISSTESWQSAGLERRGRNRLGGGLV